MFEGYYSPPFYTDLYNFKDGAQNDIFIDSYDEIPPPSPNSTSFQHLWPARWPHLPPLLVLPQLPLPRPQARIIALLPPVRREVTAQCGMWSMSYLQEQYWSCCELVNSTIITCTAISSYIGEVSSMISWPEPGSGARLRSSVYGTHSSWSRVLLYEHPINIIIL